MLPCLYLFTKEMGFKVFVQKINTLCYMVCYFAEKAYNPAMFSPLYSFEISKKMSYDSRCNENQTVE